MAVSFSFEKLKEMGVTADIAKKLTLRSKNLMPQFKKNHFSSNEQVVTVKMFFVKNKKIYLPFTFSKNYFKTTFNQKENYPQIFDSRDGKFRGSLLERQIEPFNEAREYLKKEKTVTIALYPGFGKTFLGCMLSWYLNLYTCVLIHQESIAKQWVKTFQKYFDLPPEEIVLVTGKTDFSKAKVIVAMDGRVEKIPDSVKEKIGLLIIDEAHCFCTPSRVVPMLSFTPKYVIAETATPEKDNGLHTVIQSIAGEHFIRKLSTKPYKFYIVHTNLDFAISSSGNIFGELLTNQASSKERNKIVVDILKKNQKFKTIIVTSRKQHCEILHDLISEEGMESSELYGNKKNYVPKNILIGTGSKMGVGFDEANFCDNYDGTPSELLLITYTFASWAPFEQVRGRGMRSENPKVVMFMDNNSITVKHFRKIKKWVKESNGEIINVKKLDDLTIG